MWETTLKTPGSVKKEGEELLLQSQDFPAAHGEPEVKQVIPLQPMEDHAEADIHSAVYGRPHDSAERYSL